MSSIPPTSFEGPPDEETHLWEYIHIVLRRRNLVLAIFLLAVAIATVRTFLARPVYQASAQILIERENPNVLTFKEVAEVDAARDDYYQTQYKLLQSRVLARRVIHGMNLLQDPEFGGPRDPQQVEAANAAEPGASPLMNRAIDGFLGRVRVQPVKNSRLVLVSFEAYRPELAARAANTLSQFYIKQTLEFRYQTSAEAGQWLGTQVEDQRRKAEQAEIALQKLKEKEGIVNIEERRTLLEQKLKELGSALTTLKTERLEKEALYYQMRNAPNPEELPEVMKSSLVQSLRIDLANLERQQAQLLEKYLDQHPEVVRVRNGITEAKKRIAAESQRVIRAAENDYKAAAAQEGSVAAALEAAKAEALELSQRSIQYDTLKREVEASKEVLNSLLSRHKQTDVAQELKASNIRIVDQAVVPRSPIRPNRRQDILLGAILGLGFGIALAFFLDYLDNTVKTPEDIRTQFGVPLLGVVREMKEGGDLVVRPTGQGVFHEGYRLVRTALAFCWPEQASRVLVVTSTAPGEGKTLTAVNLALTLVSTSARVLLVDCDLRKAQAHALLKTRRSPGLSDVLVGKAKPSESIQRIQDLHFLGSGSFAPSPADLMTTAAMKGFLDGLRSVYDWIVVDTPPVGAVADALILAPLSDGVILVLGAEMVAKKSARHTLERLAETGARVLGIVLNRAQVEKYSYYYSRYYGHYYGDDYGYGYGRPRPVDNGKVTRIHDKRAVR